MELLTQTNYVEYDHEYNINDVINGIPREKHTIQAGYGTVGTYATRERCLEIIDEIQALIHPEPLEPSETDALLFGEDDVIHFSQVGTPFYQMPKE